MPRRLQPRVQQARALGGAGILCGVAQQGIHGHGAPRRVIVRRGAPGPAIGPLRDRRPGRPAGGAGLPAAGPQQRDAILKKAQVLLGGAEMHKRGGMQPLHAKRRAAQRAPNLAPGLLERGAGGAIALVGQVGGLVGLLGQGRQQVAIEVQRHPRSQRRRQRLGQRQGAPQGGSIQPHQARIDGHAPLAVQGPRGAHLVQGGLVQERAHAAPARLGDIHAVVRARVGRGGHSHPADARAR